MNTLPGPAQQITGLELGNDFQTKSATLTFEPCDLKIIGHPQRPSARLVQFILFPGHMVS